MTFHVALAPLFVLNIYLAVQLLHLHYIQGETQISYHNPKLQVSGLRTFSAQSVAMTAQLLDNGKDSDSDVFPVFVTATSDDHFHELQTLLLSITDFFKEEPRFRMIIYSLGMEAYLEDFLRAHWSEKVSFRYFDFDSYPAHVTNLLEYRWKPLIIAECLKEFPMVWWIDSSIFFHWSRTHDIQPILNWVHNSPNSLALFTDTKTSLLRATNPRMYHYFPMAHPESIYFSEASNILVARNSKSRRILYWWLLCALEKDCMSPTLRAKKLARLRRIIALLIVILIGIIFISNYNSKHNHNAKKFVLDANTHNVLTKFVIPSERFPNCSDYQWIGHMPFKSILPSDHKLILDWTGYYYYSLEPLWERKKCHCSESRCHITTDRSRVSDADTVLFHGLYYDRKRLISDIPEVRPTGQKYVFYMAESLANTKHIHIEQFKNIFNWTMTYRIDSDISWPYGVVANGRSKHFNEEDFQSLVANKTKLVAQFASNCDSPSKRQSYVEELQKHIPVDIYGNCGNFSCPRFELPNCMAVLTQKYKFYLAFENSVCDDYISEKFFRFRYFVVPITLKKSIAANIGLHEGTYIAADQFDSAAHLAEYVKYLDRNHYEYLKYFDWRHQYSIQTYSNETGLCKLCSMLHQRSLPEKAVEDVHAWWFDRASCYGNYAQILLNK